MNLNYYALTIILGIFLSFFYLLWIIHRYRLPDAFRLLFGIALVIPFVLFGARLWTLFSPLFLDHFLNQKSATLKTLFFLGIKKEHGIYSIDVKGLSFHGALVFGFLYLLLFFRWYSRKHFYSQLFCFDLFLPIILIMQILVRWGNFFNKELLSEIPFTENYPEEYGWIPEWFANYLRPKDNIIYDSNSLHHPLVLYESFANFLLFIFIFWFWPYLFRKISIRPWIQNSIWNRQWNEINKKLKNSSFFKKSYWKLFWEKHRFQKLCWKKALHNSELSYKSAPKITLSSRVLYCRRDALRTDYALIRRDIYRDYQYFPRWIRLIKILFRRNSWALTNYFNPYHLKIPRVGSYMGLYLIGHAIIRISLQSFRFDADQMAITIPFSIFLLFFGFLWFIFVQFLAPARFRSLGWFYETRY